jgi:hypothetical protein
VKAILSFLAFLLLAPDQATAQAPREARLLVTVVDQTRAVIPSATITVAGVEEATRSLSIAPSSTSPQGLATIAGLAPGRYEVKAEFDGFEPGVLKDVRVRPGDNRHVIVLALKKVEAEVTVGQDRQAAAADRRGAIFGSALTREQIDALSDDPEEMRRQLQEIAGGDGIIRVDSFEGAALPPKSQIKSIHVTRDQFAAENHGAGGLFIDIITQPGMGSIRGGGNFRLRDGSMSGRSPFTPTKGPEQIKNFGLNFGGSLIKEKSSFSLSINGMRSFETSNLNAALPSGTRAEALALRSPRNNTFMSGSWDYAITRDQTVRVGYNQSSFTNENLGIGEYNLPERAFSQENHAHNLRIQEAGPLGRRFFTNTRLQFGWTAAESSSAIEAPTIHVNDAFTSGGAQIAGGRRSKTFNLASDLDYVRGIHSVRTGIQVEGGRHRSSDRANYLGTYTFESLDAYEAGTPRSYTRRIGDPTIEYLMMQAGVYVQDDIRVSRSLTLSPGLRYEAQTHLDDVLNLGPRFGITWAPFKSGKTSLRGSAGIFHEWMGTGTYDQALRVNGLRQQELNIVNPAYPDPGGIGDTPPTNRYLLGDDLVMTRLDRLSAGIDQTLSSKVRVNAGYAYTRGAGVWRGLNLNAPDGGIRPDPRFSNIVQAVSDAGSRQHSVTTGFNINFAGRPGPPNLNGAPFGPQSGPRFDWKRTSINGFYTFGRLRNNSDGAFGLPASSSLDTEWGAANNDVRHRLLFGISSSALRNLSAFINVGVSSATPYTIRTGRDDNGDLVFNDRPAGVGRNTERTAMQWSVNANVIYTITFGKPASGGGPPLVGIMIAGPGAAPQVMTVPPPPARYRLGFVVSAQNLTNHSNYGGYSGTLTSPFFGRATTVVNPRKMDIGVQFGF